MSTSRPMDWGSFGGGGSGFNMPFSIPTNIGAGLSQFLSGMFNDTGKPYRSAMDEFKRYLEPGMNSYQPFTQAGTNAINPFVTALNQMKDPTQFMKRIMSGYSESPIAQKEREAAMNAGINAASANGLAGSTPFVEQMQRTAGDISSRDMDRFFQNALNVHGGYLSGLSGLMGQGMSGLNSENDIRGRLAEMMGQGRFGEEMGENRDTSNVISGLIRMFLGG